MRMCPERSGASLKIYPHDGFKVLTFCHICAIMGGMETKNLEIIGNNALVEVAGIKKIPAKVDTGADSSSIWASQITINDKNQLEFCLFEKSSPFYTGKILTASEFWVKQVRSSNGQVAVRYVTPLIIKVKGRKIRARFTLSDRSSNRFPILIGRKTLQNKFLVDVSKIRVSRSETFDNRTLAKELASDPQAFHQKYMTK